MAGSSTVKQRYEKPSYRVMGKKKCGANHFGDVIQNQGSGNAAIENASGATSLALRQLRLCASKEGGTGLILGRGTEIPFTIQCARMCQDVNKSKSKFLKKR